MTPHASQNALNMHQLTIKHILVLTKRNEQQSSGRRTSLFVLIKHFNAPVRGWSQASSWRDSWIPTQMPAHSPHCTNSTEFDLHSLGFATQPIKITQNLRGPSKKGAARKTILRAPHPFDLFRLQSQTCTQIVRNLHCRRHA